MKTTTARTRPAMVVALALFLSACAGVAAADMDLSLAAVPVNDAAAVTAVQLLQGERTELLAATAGQVSLVATADGQARLNPTMSLDSSSTWEIRRFDDGLTVLYTEAGSATSWVMSKSSTLPRGARIHEDTFVVYLQPHFVRGPGSPSGMTAIRHRDGISQVMHFSYDAANRQNVVREIGRPATTILDARLLRDAAGYWLFTLLHAPDEATAPVRGARLATILTAERLDDALNARGDAIRVFGSRPVYEFDVQAAADGEIAVLATTPAGAIVGRGRLTDMPLPADQWKETPFAAPLSSPSLLISDGSTHAAALERAGEPAARLLRGRVD